MVDQKKKTSPIRLGRHLVIWSMIIWSALLINACGGSKRLSKDAVFEPEAFNDFYDGIHAVEMKGKVRIIAEEGNSSYSSNTVIRVAGDSIWVTGKIIGIELFRALVTADEGIQVLNRSDKTLSTATWEEVQNKYKNTELNFETLRNLLLGNPFLIKGAQYNYYNNKKRGVLEYDYAADDVQLFIDIAFKKRLREIGWVLENDQIAIEAYYSNFDSKSLENIPYFRNYITYIHNVKPINIELEIKNLSFNEEISLPFDIPDRYTRVSLFSL